MTFLGPALALLIAVLSICLISLPFALSAGAGLIELAYQLSRLMWIPWLVFGGVSFLLTIRFTKLTKRLGTSVLWTALFITLVSFPARKTPMWLMGLYPVNVEVPQGVSPGAAVPLMLTMSGIPSNTVTIAVQ